MTTKGGTSQAEAGGGIGGWLGRLRLGESRQEGSLEVVPLVLDGDGGAPGLLLTRQAVEAGVLEIVERGEGVVQELLAWNKGDRPVVILEGDTLVGCKQNRVVAHSVVVAPGTSLAVPVGCMERGRWHHETGRFSVGDMKMSPHVRRGTVADVKTATLSGRAPSLDQSRLWRDVDSELAQPAASRPRPPTTTRSWNGKAARRARASVRARSGARPGRRDRPVRGRPRGPRGDRPPRLVVRAVGAHARQLPDGLLARPRAGAARARERRRVARPRAVGAARGDPRSRARHDLDLQGPGLSGVGLAMDGGPVHVAVFPA